MKRIKDKIKAKTHKILITAMYRGTLYVIITIFISIIAATTFNHYYVERMQDRRDTSHIEEMNHIISEMQNQLRLSGTPIMIVSKNKSMIDVIEDGDQRSKEIISDVLLSMIENMENVDQIRILNLSGDELIRVDRDSQDQCCVVNEEDLQNKGDRYYFKETLKTEDGELYISPMDLNIEYGQIEEPIKPMIRIGKPIKSLNGDIIGAIIINVLGQNILDVIGVNQVHQNDHISLVNTDGYYLYGGDELDFSFMYSDKEDEGFFSDHKVVWNEINKNKELYYDNKDMFYMKALSPINSQGFLNDQITWYLVVQMYEADIIKDEEDFKSVINSISTLIIVGLLILSYLLGSTQANSKIYKEELIQNATYDTLTNLYNRRIIMRVLHQMIELSRRNKRPLSILYIDVNDLKLVNDTIGHFMGDKMIVGAATSIKDSIRSSDVVARLGGDEFLVVLPNCPQENVKEIIAKIEIAFEQKGMELMNRKWEMSYGSALLKDKETIKQFIQRADDYMYENKKLKKG